MNFHPMPGIVIIQADKETSGLTLTTKNQTRLLRGTVIAVGGDLTTDIGESLKMESYAAVGNTLYFLSYEGDYDNAFIDNARYYMVKIQDLRTRI